MKKVIVVVVLLLCCIASLSGCITKRNYYNHYSGKLIAVEPITGMDSRISFYFEDIVITLNVEGGRTKESVYNECSKFLYQNITLVYERIELIYIYCFESGD